MEQPRPPDHVPEDVLSIGEERSPRWRLLLPLLALVLLGLGAYQLVSRPSPEAAPPPAAAALGRAPALLAESTFTGHEGGLSGHRTSVRLGNHLVPLRGPGVLQPHRETSARVLQRIGPHWLVALTSRACHGGGTAEVSYGIARASGRFTAWDPSSIRRGRTWHSPDRSLLLVQRGPHLLLRRTSTGEVLAILPAVG